MSLCWELQILNDKLSAEFSAHVTVLQITNLNYKLPAEFPAHVTVPRITNLNYKSSAEFSGHGTVSRITNFELQIICGILRTCHCVANYGFKITNHQLSSPHMSLCSVLQILNNKLPISRFQKSNRSNKKSGEAL